MRESWNCRRAKLKDMLACAVDQLERRLFLAGASESMTLVVNGDLSGNPANDTIVVRPYSNPAYIEVLINGAQQPLVAAAGITRVAVNGLGGNDSIDCSAMSIPANIAGGDGDDTLVGGSANDTITGGNGNDSIVGGAGNDVFNGNAGMDSLYGQDGDDEIRGGKDNDYLDGGVGNDLLYGNKGDDSISGENGNDTLQGGDGDDWLLAGAYMDADSVDGGEGMDAGEIGPNDSAVAAVELERRTSGDTLSVSARVVNGDLVINGITRGAWLTLDQKDLPADSVRITPYLTNVNFDWSGYRPQVFSGISGGIVVHLKGGDNRLTFQNMTIAGGLTVDGDSGKDTILLDRCTVGGDIRMSLPARDEADAKIINIYDSVVGGETNITAGRGADVVSFDRSSFMGTTDIRTRGGNDSIATGNSTFASKSVIDGGAGNNLTTMNQSIHLSYDFGNGDEGWEAGFADYGPEMGFAGESGIRELPPELGPGTGMLMGGTNHSDDLFMFLKRHVDSLVAKQAYQVTFTITFASNVPSGMGGIGGSPGEAVNLKAGATEFEPKAVLDDAGYWRLNLDKRAYGRDATVAGTFANGLSPDDPAGRLYHEVRHAAVHTTRVTAGLNGDLWLFVGTDSGFEGRTEIYYLSITAALCPVVSAL